MSNTLFNYFTKSPSLNTSDNKKQSKQSPVLNVKSTPKSGSKKQKSSDIPAAKKAKTDPEDEKIKTPKSSKKPSKENETPNRKDKRKLNVVESPEDDVSDNDKDDMEEVSPCGSNKKKTRKRIKELESDGSEDEYKPPDSGKEDESSECSESCVESSDIDNCDDTEDEPTPQKKRKRDITKGKKDRSSSDNKNKAVKKLNCNFLAPGKAKITPSKSLNSSVTFDSSIDGTGESSVSEGNWTHLKFDFLKPENIRDVKNRRPTDLNYDPRTLKVPEDFKKNLTPAHRQWWQMKTTHFDCVLFFKVGKFYELFHMDAVIGVNELNLTYMRGEFAHSGFPEIAYGRFSTTLIEKGYRVARIEQTETPDMMEKRCKTMSKVTKFDKVVNREICRITSKGTRVYGILDGETAYPEAFYLMAVCEKKFDHGGTSAYGVCFLDTSIGLFHIGQFIDDKHCSRLHTMVAHYPPAQVLYERGQISQKTQHLFNITLSSSLKDSLQSDTEFLGSSKALVYLAEGNYFQENSFPEEIKSYLSKDDSLGLSASEEGELAIRSLGAILWYLKRCQLDQQLFRMNKFCHYVPVDNIAEAETIQGSENSTQSEKEEQSLKKGEEEETKSSPTSSQTLKSVGRSNTPTIRHMVLDAVTLRNLHVLQNSSGGTEGTLLNKLDNCSTPFGKRLLYQWVCSPLYNIESIITRQKAVSLLSENLHVVNEAKPLLCQLPDLERLLSRIYAQSSSGLDPSHPDVRAIMFEEKTYSKKRIIEFTGALSGFQNTQNICKIFQDSGICDDSELIARCCNFTNYSSKPGNFPDLTNHLNFFKNAFDHDEAIKEGRIMPTAGVDTEYDSVVDTLDSIAVELKDYLKQQCRYFGANVTYVGTDKKRYQLEVCDSASKKAGSEYELQGQRKGYKRFWTPKCKELLERQIAAEDTKTTVLHGLRRRIFSRFSERMNDWHAAVQCLSVLDVLISLSDFARGGADGGQFCVPKFKYLANETAAEQLAIVDLKSGRYPCTTGDESFIPNDTVIGENSANLVLVTGPNMGGKSTLMRQLGLIVILAQMGSLVPAESIWLHPVDRIFTRLGANDDIMSGESTFHMELSETSTILKHATAHSLVLIDELGRGTSTYDGTAIAASVLNELIQRMKCRTLFSTHYHSLVEDFKHFNNVRLGHMSCMAETEGDDNGDDENGGKEETVTFLYKFAEGACPKSYGFNAARLAGVPMAVIKSGRLHSRQLEKEVHRRKLFKQLFSGATMGNYFIADTKRLLADLVTAY